ncbi:Selenocysteine lyase/Cysteine desulfurase [Streptomyces sp. DvalAA-14]|uniref:aminotransferase class V-fold PLP-dependent enzyme n=1 Tax=unclassified Streptomyces TaxID=2593676 RepID=UPI00081B2E4D|nr:MULTISPECIES: aminotransferase class V-fold PLP-dependent enzyme [unclassified Streptomyces]MYS18836.1 aminotransferase class V-fold PLP-dependent enzyme [Streptomyces sp. SID4948]SCD30204.1 Selenocysteine lyase/Cysteine desulfurase [Streptomyces sp. DvalAA-14]
MPTERPAAAPAAGPLPGYAAHFDEPEGYLDFARYGPPSRDVLTATADALARAARADHRTVNALMRAEPAARDSAARLAGSDPAHTVLLPNASTGLFHAAFGIPTGTVLVPRTDFPANHYPWRRTEALSRAVPRWLEPDDRGRVTADVVRAALGDGGDDVVALAVSAVDFRTGFRADLGALRDAIGPDRLLIVDAIQGFGIADLPWQAADVVVAGGQKWLRASWSTGFAALSDRALERLEPTLTGWTGVEDVALFDDLEHPPAAGAQRWSISNLSPVAAAAFAAALAVVEEATVPAIEARIAARVDELIDTVRGCGGEILSPTAPAERAGIVSFRLPGTDAAAVAEALHAHEVTPSVRATSVRLSPHASTRPAAADRVRAALASLR